ncbi:uncharacterized protein LOC135463632 isoform X3 [Liolophura sinensis]|uniref:uncharacterized protein LOC135463632 isoform X3 n=1 Tax=Liolophura sinensis TaxID=3198878 RepID=UPI0031583A88
MGVSLERVQFKFASIIGELCSEPIVLSQFAVWLDLRLAEYKSKGAISLDCSGEKPDPSWLKGLRTATAPAVKKVLGSRLAPRTGLGFSRGGMYSRSSAFHRRNVNSHSRMAQSGQGQTRSQTVTDMQSDVNNRLSGADTMGAVPHLSENTDDIVVIKDEPSEDNQGGVFPVSLHSHQALEPDSRKRPARDSVSSDTQDSSTPFKVRKNPSEESPLNQSLISVLGSAFEDQNPEMPSGTNDSATVSDMDYSASLQDQSDQSANIQWADNSTNFQSSAQPTTSTSTFSPNRPSATVTSNSSLAEGSISMDTLDQSELNVMQDLPRDEVTRSSTQALLDTSLESRDNRFIPCNKPKLKKTNSVPGSYARIPQRYIADYYRDEHRELLDIPPAILNENLETFFRSILRRGSKNYTWATFRTMMSHQDSYFKENSYPVVLSKAPELLRSRNVFHERRIRIRVCDTSVDFLQKLCDWLSCSMIRSTRHVKKIDLAVAGLIRIRPNTYLV